MPVILLILLVLGASGQTPAPRKAAPRKPPAPPTEAAPATWPLKSIKIQGNKIYSEQQIIAASGLKLGQTVDTPAFEAARERLLKTGAFEIVGYQYAPDADGKGYSGTFTVTEVEQLFPFRFEDLPASDPEIRSYLKQKEPLFENRIPGTRQFLDRMAVQIGEFLAQRKGFKDRVVGRMTPDGPGELQALFRPATGPPVIGEVRFTGSEAMPASTLNNAFGLIAIGVAYSERRVRELLDSGIRPLFEERGRLTVSFPKITSKPMEKIDGLHVDISVVDGPVFKSAKIKSVGSSVPDKELLETAKMKEGEVANFTEAQAAAERIVELLKRQGFLRAKTTVERSLNEKDSTVDIIFRTDDGPRFGMGKLTVVGLDINTEPAIRKLWSMAPGKPFNAGYPQYFLDRVREDGYLDNLGKTRFEEQVNDQDHTVDITLYFSGAPPAPDQKKKRRELP